MLEAKLGLGKMRPPLQGIANDLNGRLACYKQDWIGGIRSGFGYVSGFLNPISSFPTI